ncbi:MAG: FHA domain-containing protein [Gemmataceae bacterium]|nr:FHA domain-containing protein [Gemmataceae bacterium]
MPRLIVIKGADAGRQFVLDADSAGVGRDSSSKVRLTDTEASRKHAEFVRTADGYRVRDLGSANGTWVNNQSVRDALLQSGDHVQVGQTVLVFTLDRGEGPAPNDLADRISLISREGGGELSSAIVRTVSDLEGSRILTNPERMEGPWQRNASLLAVLYEAIQATSHTLDLDALLDKLLELLLKAVPADRSAILLATEEGGYEPRAGRWRDPARKDTIPISRTIIDHVLREKQGVRYNSGSRDERFQASQSIVKHSIEEAVCVPMKGRHQTLGVLWLDANTPANKLAAARLTERLSDDHLSLAAALAHQAALAVEETRYYQAMVAAERLAAVGQTVAALSHDIKNILQGLEIAGTLLESGLRDKDEGSLRKGWERVRRNQGRIKNLMMNMLDFSKEREPCAEPTDLNALAREVAELLAPRAAEKGARLETRLDGSLPEVQADADGIHRALVNIVANAIDAVGEGGKVLLGTSKEPVDASREPGVRMQVKDNGAGIPAESLEAIFKPFASTKGSKGTGLGLAVSRKILREHGGDVTVISEVGKGSVFTLRLPLRSPLANDASATRAEMPVVPPPEE